MKKNTAEKKKREIDLALELNIINEKLDLIGNLIDRILENQANMETKNIDDEYGDTTLNEKATEIIKDKNKLEPKIDGE